MACKGASVLREQWNALNLEGESGLRALLFMMFQSVLKLFFKKCMYKCFYQEWILDDCCFSSHGFFFFFFFFFFFWSFPGWDLSHICDLYQSSRQHWIINSLSKARDRTCVLMETSQICFHWATTGTPHGYFKSLYESLLMLSSQVCVLKSSDSLRLQGGSCEWISFTLQVQMLTLSFRLAIYSDWAFQLLNLNTCFKMNYTEIMS